MSKWKWKALNALHVGSSLWHCLRAGKNGYPVFCIPLHGNLGDQAILYAEAHFLRDVDPSIQLVEVPHLRLTKVFRGILSADTILIHGGGFLGTLWAHEEQKARAVIQAFHDKRIVIFPQTIYFSDTPEGREAKETTRRIFDSHPDLWLCVREETSYQLAKEMFQNVHILLVPDMVLSLPAHTSRLRRKGALLCLRSDLEQVLVEGEKEGILNAIQKHLPGEPVSFTDTVVPYSIDAKSREKELRSKLDEFAGSALVITDRLHGMIFAALSGTPCIALNNSSKKVEGVYPWLKGNEYIRFIDGIDELDEAVRQVLTTKGNVYRNDHLRPHYQPLRDLIRKAGNLNV